MVKMKLSRKWVSDHRPLRSAGHCPRFTQKEVRKKKAYGTYCP